ncbi:peptidase A4 family-domain-containing protein [Amylocarpus encephaloides]|uniref:Peptidase A4 family-domain-containing protein n=1 Tax=Amylocarpus encephaloides TaxID=45428 RepID=A0A9P7YB34_9HELO|nr:peptidase A4 family-domain-containing protein [Amylocarpus encephaloides]
MPMILISLFQLAIMYVNATTTTTGTATIENLTTGKVASIDLTSTSALGGQNAEWIVEDFEQNSELVAFANFGNVTFADCIAKISRSSEGVWSAGIMDIKDDNTILTDVNTISDSSFGVEYTGSSAVSSSGASTTTTVVAASGQTGGPGDDSGSGGPEDRKCDRPDGVNAAWYSGESRIFRRCKWHSLG